MDVCRRQTVLIPKCQSKPGNNVSYHLIVRRGTFCSFLLYTEYLSYVATQYPSLCIHVFFLVDDSLETARRIQREAISFDSYDHFPFTGLYVEHNYRDIRDFTRRYGNVNVTIMTLSKYMNMIPLKQKWRNIPLPYLTFYARIFSVWQSGGIAMDLNYFNDKYNYLKDVDYRISAVLKQHNDGIKVEEYTNALKKFDREGEYQFFTLFNGLMHQFFNETRKILIKNFPFPQSTTKKNGMSKNKPLLRTNRSKSDFSDFSNPINDTNNKSKAVSNASVETLNLTKETDLKKNQYLLLSNTFNSNIMNGKNKTAGLNKPEIKTEMQNETNAPRKVLFYEFSGAIAPLPEPDTGNAEKSGNDEVHLLSIESDGMFVASSSRLHPFLKQLISIHCPYIKPKFAIQNTLLTQCSGLFTKDSHCNNIYLL